MPWVPLFMTMLFMVPPFSGASATASPVVQVQQVDPDFDVSPMKQKGVEIHRLGDPLPSGAVGLGLPGPGERDEALKKAGLDPDLKDFDEMDRDLIVAKARSYSPEQLQKAYPAIPPEKLSALSTLLKGAKK